MPGRLPLVLLCGAEALNLPFRRQTPPLPPVPALFTESDARPIVLFDGECNLCNAGVNLLLDRDRSNLDERGNLRVAALQSGVGRLLIARLPEDVAKQAVCRETGEYKSIVVQGDGEAWVGSRAVLKIGRQLRGPLGWLARLGSCVPAALRDPVYTFVSRRRKRWFGASDQCRLWDDNWEQRFVDDAALGLGARKGAGAPAPRAGDIIQAAGRDPCRGGDGAFLNGLVGEVLRLDGAGGLEVALGAGAATVRAADAVVLRRPGADGSV